MYGQYLWIVKRNQLCIVEEWFFIAGIKFERNVASNRPKKQFPNSNYLRKQTLKSRIALFKLCKENDRVQSKISDISFSIEFRFETKIGGFVTRLCAFAHSYSYTFSQITMAPDLLWKGPHIPISSVIFVLSIMLMNVFVCPYSFVNITVIPVHFCYFIFCFKLYFPIVDIIVNHFYLLFTRSRKTNRKCCDKNEKPTAISSWRSQEGLWLEILYLKNIFF